MKLISRAMSLSPPNPWASVVNGAAEKWVSEMAVVSPKLGLLSLGAYDLIVSVVAVRPLVARTDAVWALANAVGEWWPGWLGPIGVACSISAGNLSVVASPDSMVAVGQGGFGRAGWFEHVRPTIG